MLYKNGDGDTALITISCGPSVFKLTHSTHEVSPIKNNSIYNDFIKNILCNYQFGSASKDAV